MPWLELVDFVTSCGFECHLILQFATFCGFYCLKTWSSVFMCVFLSLGVDFLLILSSVFPLAIEGSHCFQRLSMTGILSRRAAWINKIVARRVKCPVHCLVEWGFGWFCVDFVLHALFRSFFVVGECWKGWICGFVRVMGHVGVVFDWFWVRFPISISGFFEVLSTVWNEVRFTRLCALKSNKKLARVKRSLNSLVGEMWLLVAAVSAVWLPLLMLFAVCSL